ncbi:EthD domain-containing protein [Chloroflexota bacterium]
MVKFVSIFKRPPTMTFEELKEWWLGPHAALGKQMPGVKKYTVSLSIAAPDDMYRPGEEAGKDFDGIAELWFDSFDDLRKAQQSETMTKAKNDVVAHGVTEVAKMFFEEYPQIP